MSNTNNENKIKFTRLISAYEEAVQNNIISIETQPPLSNRTLDDFTKLLGIKFTGGTTLGTAITANDDTNTVDTCLQACIANNGCNGALYEEKLQWTLQGTLQGTSLKKKCQLYSVLPQTGDNYQYDASSNTIIYDNYGSNIAPAKPSFKDTLNYKIKTQLEDQLNALGEVINGTIITIPDSLSLAITNLGDANKVHAEFEDAKKNNQDIKAQLHNSGLDVIKAKAIYILFIAVLLILLAIYIRDFNFSIIIFIILFLMISVYGSIFLGAFLLVLIVLYLVYYAY